MKSIFRSKSAWLAVLIGTLPHWPELVDWLVSYGAASWVLSAAGVLGVVLRALTKDAVSLKPQAPRVDPVAFVIIAVLLVTGCVAQFAVTPDDKEQLTIKTSAPSLIEYRLDGELRFRRTSAGALKGIKCTKAAP